MQIVFIDFFTAILQSVSAFLMTEPIIYFTVIVILLCVVGLVNRIIS